MKNEPHRNRSAITGRFLNDAAAARWPKTSVREAIDPPKPPSPPPKPPKR